MAQHLFEQLQHFIVAYGYWAVAVMLLLENAGVPVPGESVLLVASFMAAGEQRLNLTWLILVGAVSATVGDNIGYWIGRKGGRPLLLRYAHVFRIPPRALAHGEALFRRYGAPTVLVARFIFGLRVFAGPLAGVLRMPWGRFLVCNFAGATLWTVVICVVGFLFGQHWQEMLAVIRRIDGVALGLLACAVLVLWWRRRFRGV